jgi:predicted ATPase
MYDREAHLERRGPEALRHGERVRSVTLHGTILHTSTRRKRQATAAEGPLIRAIALKRSDVPDFERYPFSIPAVRQLDELTLDPHVTFFIGENGSGKSTLVEAIAVAAGYNPEGGSRHMTLETRASHSELHKYLRLVRGTRRPRTGYFLRAESFFNVATYIEEIPDAVASHGGGSLHERSHGESFISLVTHRFGPEGLYILDEPEAALSVRGDLALMRRMHDLINAGSQFIISTHSPILLGFPDALIYALGEEGISRQTFDDNDVVATTRAFLSDREGFLRHLLTDDHDSEIPSDADVDRRQ